MGTGIGLFALGKWDLGHWDWDLVTENGKNGNGINIL